MSNRGEYERERGAPPPLPASMQRLSARPPHHASSRPTPRATVIPGFPARERGSNDPMRVEELSSQHLVSVPDFYPEPRARISRLIAEELHGAQSAHPSSTARTDHPPAIGRALGRSWRAPIVVAALTFGVAFNAAIGGYFLYQRAAERRPPAVASVTPPPGARAAAAPAGLCGVAGEPRVVARRALVRGGVEAAAQGSRLGVAVVTGAKEGAAFELDPSSLAVTSTVKVIAPEVLRRVLPALASSTPIDAAIDAGGDRTVTDDDGDVASVSVQGGFVTWTPAGAPEAGDATKLWRITGSAGLEAPRVLGGGGGRDRVVAYRRGAEIWIGALGGGGAPTAGALVRVSEAAAQVGAPSLATADGVRVVAWAQKDSAGAPWSLRWKRFRDVASPGPLRAFTLPAGGPGIRAIAPSVAALRGGRFLLAWTEGTTRHAVRAQVIGANDAPLGAAMTLSGEGIDAGQEQIVIDDAGRGGVAYLASKGRAFELVVTPITCAVAQSVP